LVYTSIPFAQPIIQAEKIAIERGERGPPERAEIVSYGRRTD
jgi:hypothetical protein